MILSKKLLLYLLFGVGMLHATFNLPTYINLVRRAQFQLIQESKATTWGKPWVPSDH